MKKVIKDFTKQVAELQKEINELNRRLALPNLDDEWLREEVKRKEEEVKRLQQEKATVKAPLDTEIKQLKEEKAEVKAVVGTHSLQEVKQWRRAAEVTYGIKLMTPVEGQKIAFGADCACLSSGGAGKFIKWDVALGVKDFEVSSRFWPESLSGSAMVLFCGLGRLCISLAWMEVGIHSSTMVATGERRHPVVQAPLKPICSTCW
jgi:seryl-tRNA synthetase